MYDTALYRILNTQGETNTIKKASDRIAIWLKDLGLIVKMSKIAGCPPLCGGGCMKKHGDHYRVILRADDLREPLSFDFWISQWEKQNGSEAGIWNAIRLLYDCYLRSNYQTYQQCLDNGLSDNSGTRARYRSIHSFRNHLKNWFTDEETKKIKWDVEYNG